MNEGMSDILNPLLKRIKAVSDEFSNFALIVRSARATGDKVSAEAEEFFTKMQIAHAANLEAYRVALEWQGEQDKLTALVESLRNMPDAVERLANTQLIAELTRGIAKQNYIAAALAVAELEAELHYLMIKEIASRVGGIDIIKSVREAINQVLNDHVENANPDKSTTPGR